MVSTLLAGMVSSLPAPGGLSDGETAGPGHGQHYSWQTQLAPSLSQGAYQMETMMDPGMVGTLLAGTVSSFPVPVGLSDIDTAGPRHGLHTPGRYS